MLKAVRQSTKTATPCTALHYSNNVTPERIRWRPTPLFPVGAGSSETEGRTAALHLHSYPNPPLPQPSTVSPSTQHQFFDLKSHRLPTSATQHEQVEPQK